MSEDLRRFVTAQDEDDTYDTALAELRRGRKTTHWMWFVFPQIEGLGQSPTARYYGVHGLQEARAYVADPVLGPRLRESFATAIEHGGGDAARLFGGIDAMKFRSSATLFAHAAPDEPVYRQALDAFYGGEEDAATLARLRRS